LGQAVRDAGKLLQAVKAADTLRTQTRPPTINNQFCPNAGWQAARACQVIVA
jgi:hypothetical protein